jgi:hypothetical protein
LAAMLGPDQVQTGSAIRAPPPGRAPSSDIGFRNQVQEIKSVHSLIHQIFREGLTLLY